MYTLPLSLTFHPPTGIEPWGPFPGVDSIAVAVVYIYVYTYTYTYTYIQIHIYTHIYPPLNSFSYPTGIEPWGPFPGVDSIAVAVAFVRPEDGAIVGFARSPPEEVSEHLNKEKIDTHAHTHTSYTKK